MKVSGWGVRVGLAVVLLLAACAQEQMVVRGGAQVPVSRAIQADLETAQAHLDAGEPAKAQAVLETSLTELPRARGVDRVLFLLGEAQRQQGENEAAIQTWERLLVEQGSSRFAPEARLGLAELQREAGRPELAYRALVSAKFHRAEAPVRLRMYRLLADLSRERGDWAEATVWLAYARRETEDFEAALEIDAEAQELLEGRVLPAELPSLIDRMPPGPVRDRALLVGARNALEEGSSERAVAFLEQLPERLRPAEQAERERLEELARRAVVSRQNVIGIALPLTGPYARFGQRVLRGTVLGLGIFDDPPAPYELLVRDTQGDPERAAEVVRELASEGVLAIVGPLRSVEAAAAAPIAERAQVPLVTLARRDDLAELGDYVFGFGLTTSDQIRTLAQHAVDVLGHRRFAILYPRDDYGTSFKNQFWEEIELRGGEVVGVEAYPTGAVDFQKEIKKLVGLHWLTPEERSRIAKRDSLLRRPKENAEKLEEYEGLPPIVDFDVLFLPDVASRVGLILPQLRFYDVRDVTLLGTSDWNHSDLIKIAGRDARGAVFTDAFFAGSPYPFVQDFVTRYYAAYGDEPGRLAATGYDAAAILRTIMDDGSERSRSGMRSDLLDVRDFAGVSGLTSFDDSGGARKALYLLTVKRGAIEQVEP